MTNPILYQDRIWNTLNEIYRNIGIYAHTEYDRRRRILACHGLTMACGYAPSVSARAVIENDPGVDAACFDDQDNTLYLVVNDQNAFADTLQEFLDNFCDADKIPGYTPYLQKAVENINGHIVAIVIDNDIREDNNIELSQRLNIMTEEFYDVIDPILIIRKYGWRDIYQSLAEYAKKNRINPIDETHGLNYVPKTDPETIPNAVKRLRKQIPDDTVSKPQNNNRDEKTDLKELFRIMSAFKNDTKN